MQRAVFALVVAACGTAAPPPAVTPPPPPPAAPPVAAPIAGLWLGTLTLGTTSLRLQLHLDLAASTCSVDSLDQSAMGIPCKVASATPLVLELPEVQGSLKGAFSSDTNTLTGTWTQAGRELPIVLSREATALAATPTMPPVPVEALQPVLDKDLEKLVAAQLGPDTGVGVTIGVIQRGTRKIFSYGAVKPDSVFEIGSLTKTFTGLALAQLVQQKKVKLDDPVRTLLPKGTVAAPASGAEITLVDLSAQRSGLPRLPDNLKSTTTVNPYADYDVKALYAYLSSHGVAMPATPAFEYSNLGVGLLGEALAERAGTSYEALIQKQILTPLAMHETVQKLTPALAKRFATGHTPTNKTQPGWDFQALAGAGAIRSTADDMLTYLDAQLHPEHVAGKSPEARTLAAALVASHEVHGEVGGGMHIALNWIRVDDTGSYWHNGATAGFSSFAMFDPANDYAVIVLCNRTVLDEVSLADELGKHIARRIAGRPVTPL